MRRRVRERARPRVRMRACRCCRRRRRARRRCRCCRHRRRRRRRCWCARVQARELPGRADPKHALLGYPQEPRRERGLDCRKGSIRTNCPRPLDPTCDQHAEHTKHDSGHTSRVCPDLTLPHSLACMRAACNISYRHEAILPQFMRARGTAHFRREKVIISCRDAQFTAPAAHCSYSMGVEAASPRAAAA